MERVHSSRVVMYVPVWGSFFFVLCCFAFAPFPLEFDRVFLLFGTFLGSMSVSRTAFASAWEPFSMYFGLQVGSSRTFSFKFANVFRCGRVLGACWCYFVVKFLLILS